MTGPFKYRPDPFGDVDWEDNFLSNAIAWASIKLRMDKLRFTHTIAKPFWTNCPTCLFFRGALVGALIASLI
jgi:hypothetical protein